MAKSIKVINRTLVLCETCAFAERRNAETHSAECHRHAPILVEGVGTCWPIVALSDACGDWMDGSCG